MGDFLVPASDWLEIHAGLAGWAQAVGGIAGIVAAILLPWAQRRHDRSLQCHSLATALVAELVELLRRTRVIAEVLDDAIQSVSDDAPRVQADPDSALVADLSLPEPPVMAASPHQFYLLGRAGAEVQMALSAIRHFSTTLRDESRRWGSIDPRQFAADLEMVERQLDKAWSRTDHLRQGRIL